MENALIMHVGKKEDKTKEFLELLVNFWINGGAVVLLSDNDPFIIKKLIFINNFCWIYYEWLISWTKRNIWR